MRILIPSCRSLIQYVLLIVIQRSTSLDVYHSPQEFCYNKAECSGKKMWTGACFEGKRQSPIDLTVSKDQKLSPSVHIPMTHFKSDHFFMQNNGHTVNLDFTPAFGKETHIFPGYGLTTTKYRFSNAHLHWGKTDTTGSEHQLYGKYYSMELHLVHYNEKYPTLAKAVKSGDRNALAVVAVLFEANNMTRNPSFGPILRNIEEIQNKHKYWLKVEEPLDLKNLIPSEKVRIFSYQGSLTTPGCNEQVNWYVFEKPISISKEDIKEFRTVVDGHGTRMLENHRPIQKLNGRKIELMMLT